MLTTGWGGLTASPPCRPDPLSELFDSFLQRPTNEVYAKFETPGRIGQRLKDRERAAREKEGKAGSLGEASPFLAGTSLPKHPIQNL